MASLRRSASLVARSVASCALVYLLCLPLGGAILGAVSTVAGGVLRIADRPVVLTSLRARDDHVVIATHLTGTEQPLAVWDAGNLPIFLVATLGLALAAPARSPGRRAENAGLALLASALVMIATTAVQLEVTAGNAARSELGLALHGRRGETLLGALNQGIGVAMLLVPATVFALAYMRWRAEPAATSPRPSSRRPLALARTAAVVAAALAGLAWLGRAPIDPRPGLVLVVELNPDAPSARLGLAYYDTMAAFRR